MFYQVLFTYFSLIYKETRDKICSEHNIPKDECIGNKGGLGRTGDDQLHLHQ